MVMALCQCDFKFKLLRTFMNLPKTVGGAMDRALGIG
jgi:hypothetical protein